MRKYRFVLFSLFSTTLFLIGCNSSDEKNTSQLDRTSSPGLTGDLSYTVPASWINEPPRSKMRKAQYRIPGSGGAGAAEMGVFVFPGSGGAVQANIERWIGQFKQPDGSSTEAKTEIRKTESNGLPVTIIYISGTYLSGSMGGTAKEMPEHALAAAIVETSSDPWFFKTVGPQQTIDQNRSEFESFCQTFKLNN
jgi:hypothetical protein